MLNWSEWAIKNGSKNYNAVIRPDINSFTVMVENDDVLEFIIPYRLLLLPVKLLQLFESCIKYFICVDLYHDDSGLIIGLDNNLWKNIFN